MSNQETTFIQRFSSDYECYYYLAKIKWTNESFVCKKCGNVTFHKGRTPYSRRCNKCKYDESATAGTMFEKLKFPIRTAFSIIYKIANSGEGCSSAELAKQFGLQQKTCWAFKQKVQQAIGKIQQKKLMGDVAVRILNIYDEESSTWFFQETRPKQRVAVAVQIKKRRVEKAMAHVIDDDKAKYLRTFFNHYLDPSAQIIMMDGYGFKVLQKEYQIEFLSLRTKRLKPLMDYFADLKYWIGKERHNCFYNNLQGYLDEYNYRLNHRNRPLRNFEAVIRAMMKEKDADANK